MRFKRKIFIILSLSVLLFITSCSKTEYEGDMVETPVITPLPVQDKEEVIEENEENINEYVITIDLSIVIGTPKYIATGFLHGLSEDCSKPGPDYFDILKPVSFRGANLGGFWLKGDIDDNLQMLKVYYEYLNPLGVTIDYLLMDVWGSWYENFFMNRPIRFPGDDGQWDDYEDFCSVIATFVVDNDMQDFQYNLWNEPNLVKWGHSQFWPRSKEQFYEMWKRGYRQIKSIHPEAVISGPDYAPYSQEMDWKTDVEDFLDFCIENDVVPHVLTLHALPGDPVVFKGFAEKALADRDITGVTLYINEYSDINEQHPGAAAWYISRLERAEIRGSRAIWPRPNTLFRAPVWNISGELNGLMFLDTELNLSTTGIWWVYKRYADITGQLVETTADDNDIIDAVAGVDANDRKLRVLFGANKDDDIPKLGKLTVIIKAFDADPFLCDNGQINVKVERIPFNEGNPVAIPVIIKDENVDVKNGEIMLEIEWDDVTDAYAVTLG